MPSIVACKQFLAHVSRKAVVKRELGALRLRFECERLGLTQLVVFVQLLRLNGRVKLDDELELWPLLGLQLCKKHLYGHVKVEGTVAIIMDLAAELALEIVLDHVVQHHQAELIADLRRKVLIDDAGVVCLPEDGEVWMRDRLELLEEEDLLLLCVVDLEENEV